MSVYQGILMNIEFEATIQLENGYIFHIHYQQQKVSILSQIRSFLARECCEIDT